LLPAAWLAGLDASAPGLSFLLRFLLTAAAAVAVVLGGYLVYALRQKLHTDCPLCYLAHGLNIALLVLVILTVW
jgi:uncharacterized membrane protein